MKATFISKEKNNAKFSIEFTAEELEQAIIKEYQETKDKYQIDGFRKGKAPRSILEKHFGEGIFLEGAINTMINDAYPKAAEELNLEVIDRPSVDFGEVEKGKGFTITVAVDVYPEIEVKDYVGVKSEKINVEVLEADVDAEMEKLQQRNARMVAVDRPAESGDTVLLNYKGFVGDHQFEGGTAEQHPLKLGSNSFIPGFEEQLIGICVNEDRDVKVTFPEEYHAEELAGKEAIFKCQVQEIKTEEKPELDDDFAKDVSEFDTLVDLKADTKVKLQASKEEQALLKMKDSVLAKVYEANEIDIPEVLVEDEITSMMQEFDQQLRSQGLDLEKYFEYLQKDPAEFRKELREDAYRKVKTRMIVTAVAAAEGIAVQPEELDAEVDMMAAQYKIEPAKIKEMLGTENMAFLEKDIKMRKAMDFIYDKAIIK
jgi:trigger factor